MNKSIVVSTLLPDPAQGGEFVSPRAHGGELVSPAINTVARVKTKSIDVNSFFMGKV